MRHELRYSRLLPSYVLVALRDDAGRAMEWWIVPPVRNGWYLRKPLTTGFCIPSEVVPPGAYFKLGVPA